MPSSPPSRAIWDPHGVPAVDPGRGRARGRAVLGAGAGALAAGAFYAFGLSIPATIVGALAALNLLLGLVSPLLLERALARFSHGVGVALGWLLLAPLFYLVFTPLGLARRVRRDPLDRRGGGWRARGPAPRPESYERQY